MKEAAAPEDFLHCTHHSMFLLPGHPPVFSLYSTANRRGELAESRLCRPNAEGLVVVPSFLNLFS